MKARIDSPDGRALYDARFATVEPLLGNLRSNKRVDRFTLRGRAKVNAQWQLFCLVHTIENLAKAGYAARHAATTPWSAEGSAPGATAMRNAGTTRRARRTRLIRQRQCVAVLRALDEPAAKRRLHTVTDRTSLR